MLELADLAELAEELLGLEQWVVRREWLE